MKSVIGLDIGGSTTKIVGFRDEQMLGHCLVSASDPFASAYGAVGKFLNLYHLQLGDVSEILMTGVGSSYIQDDILEIPTRRADEFQSVGLGGLYLSGEKQAIVISMGTGTSFVYASRQETRHIIGSGLGGGTILGLSAGLNHIRDHAVISRMASKGRLSNVDLTVGELSGTEIPGLLNDATASNFGKVNEEASPEDLERGVLNLVFESVGTAAVLCARLEKVRKLVFVGSLTLMPEGRASLQRFAELYDVDIIIPEDAEFSTAIGAALSRKRQE